MIGGSFSVILTIPRLTPVRHLRRDTVRCMPWNTLIIPQLYVRMFGMIFRRCSRPGAKYKTPMPGKTRSIKNSGPLIVQGKPSKCYLHEANVVIGAKGEVINRSTFNVQPQTRQSRRLELELELEGSLTVGFVNQT
jgi:hypothetical protein